MSRRVLKIEKQSLGVFIIAMTCVIVSMRMRGQNLNQDGRADLILKGDLIGAQNRTYLNIPFDVPGASTASASIFVLRQEISAQFWTWESPIRSVSAAPAAAIKVT
jgi:hypothetical protein